VLWKFCESKPLRGLRRLASWFKSTRCAGSSMSGCYGGGEKKNHNAKTTKKEEKGEEQRRKGCLPPLF
jgi:hypothetical protein